MTTPKIKDNDIDEITAEIDGREIRVWSYSNRGDQRQKMMMAREFAEGWYQAVKASAAPDLMEALEEYLPILEFLEESGLWDDAAHGTGLATANKYRAAIAKAKGGDA